MSADTHSILRSALVVQWIGHNFAEVKMMVRFHPRAPYEKTPVGRLFIWCDSMVIRSCLSMDRIVPSEGTDAGSIPARSTVANVSEVGATEHAGEAYVQESKMVRAFFRMFYIRKNPHRVLIL